LSVGAGQRERVRSAIVLHWKRRQLQRRPMLIHQCRRAKRNVVGSAGVLRWKRGQVSLVPKGKVARKSEVKATIDIEVTWRAPLAKMY
jgi:hypothetical protein